MPTGENRNADKPNMTKTRAALISIDAALAKQARVLLAMARQMRDGELEREFLIGAAGEVQRARETLAVAKEMQK